MTLFTRSTRFHWAWNRFSSQCLTCKPLEILVLRSIFAFLNHFWPFSDLLPWNSLLTAFRYTLTLSNLEMVKSTLGFKLCFSPFACVSRLKWYSMMCAFKMCNCIYKMSYWNSSSSESWFLALQILRSFASGHNVSFRRVLTSSRIAFTHFKIESSENFFCVYTVNLNIKVCTSIIITDMIARCCCV